MSEKRISGYRGRALVVDLSSHGHWVERLDLADLVALVGGFGVNKLLFRRFFEARSSPLDPGNPLVLGAGPLVGFPVPGACRAMADCRLPASGALSSCSCSMGLGLALRRAGFDHLVILGRAPALSVLLVEGQARVNLLPASGLAGRGTVETHAALRRSFPRSSVLCSGPAGENLVHTSICMVDGCSTLGRGGLGAVLGSKNLKAICVSGEESPEAFDERALRRELEGLAERRRRWPLADATRRLGMMVAWPLYFRQLSHLAPSQGERENLFQAFGPEAYLALKSRRIACPRCFLPDKDELMLPGYKVKVRSTSFLNSAILGCLSGFRKAEDAAWALHRLDDLGLDFMAISAQALFLWEMGKDGLVSTGEVEGLPLGDRAKLLLELAERVAWRRGRIGEAFSRGWRGVKELFGEEVERRVPLVRDTECIYDPRISGLGTMEFEQLLCPRGPASASGGSPTYIPGMERDRMRRLTERIGADAGALERIFPEPGGFNVGRLTRYAEDWFSLFSSLGLCNRHQINRLYHVELLTRLYRSVTGERMDTGELLESASRAWGLYRDLNDAFGRGKEADRVPEAWFGGGPWFARGLPVLDYYGRELSREDLERLLLDYYEERSRPRLSSMEARNDFPIGGEER